MLNFLKQYTINYTGIVVNRSIRYLYYLNGDLHIVKIADLAKLMGKSVEELEAELAKKDVVEIDLNNK